MWKSNRIFYHYRLLRTRNTNYFKKRLRDNIELHRRGLIDDKKLKGFLDGWNGYSNFANTYNFNKKAYKVTTLE